MLSDISSPTQNDDLTEEIGGRGVVFWWRLFDPIGNDNEDGDWDWDGMSVLLFRGKYFLS